MKSSRSGAILRPITSPTRPSDVNALDLHRRERLAGRFDRAVTMPIEINPDDVKAEYRDGILALFLPRAESDKPKSIKVA